jgi:hypothetical protein
MANVRIDLPDDLARRLQGIALKQHKSLEQLALDQLRSLAEVVPEFPAGSPAAVVLAVQGPPHPGADAVDDLDAAIASGRMPVRALDPFCADR